MSTHPLKHLPFLSLSYIAVNNSKLYFFTTMAADEYVIGVNAVPPEVQSVLEEYIDLLRHTATPEEAAEHFIHLAGGSLINEDAERISLRSTIKDSSLKKDHSNIQQYSYPVVISRAYSDPTPITTGYGASAITGRAYQLWIEKRQTGEATASPVTILLPENHPLIRTPKIILMGSF